MLNGYRAVTDAAVGCIGYFKTIGARCINDQSIRTVLTGGGALLKNLDKLLREASGLPITVTEDPLSTVALGSGKALDSLEILKQVIIL